MLNRGNLILFLILIPIIILSQIYLLDEHLKFGFSDVDWGMLSFYHDFKIKYPNPIINFIETFKNWGVYAHQSYYIGLQEEIFGLNFKNFQITTHVFKALAILSFYPFLIYITRSRLAAFISTILFAFSYPAVGTMYTIVTSSDYTAVITLCFFALSYSYLIKSRTQSIKLLVPASFLFLVTFFLSTERIYPVIFIILLIEGFLILRGRSKEVFFNSIKRIVAILLPIFFIFSANKGGFLSFLLTGVGTLIERMKEGDWFLLLTPLISLGSLILPRNYWRYLGVVRLENLNIFLNYFINGPFVIFAILNFVTSISLLKKWVKFFLLINLIVFAVSILVFVLVGHHKNHFDEVLVTPALIGSFLLVYAACIFSLWLKKKDPLLLGISVGPIFAFIYIFMTWVAADTSLLFSGAHRYLTIPGALVSLFIGGLAYFFSKNMLAKNFKILSFLPFVVLVLYIFMSATSVREFFDYYIFHGFAASDQQYMKGQLAPYIENLSSDQPSLFYFEWLEDYDNGYYYDNTILGGFKTWMLWHKDINLKWSLRPVDIYWNQPQKLKEARTVKDDVKGFTVYGRFFPDKDFYAFSLKDKKVIDIKEEIIEKLDSSLKK